MSLEDLKCLDGTWYFEDKAVIYAQGDEWLMRSPNSGELNYFDSEALAVGWFVICLVTGG